MPLAQTVPDEVTALERWSEALVDIHARIAHRFRRVEVRERVRRYLAGLLARIERKHGWQLAEAMGEPDPHGVQRLLNEAVWDVDGVRDDLRAYVVEHLGDPTSGVLIVDETSFLKKGTRSCGVARQYCGLVGTTANAQVGVFLAYASNLGTAFIDRALYLPRPWTRDRASRGCGCSEGDPLRHQDHAGQAHAGPRLRRRSPGTLGRRGFLLWTFTRAPPVVGAAGAILRANDSKDNGRRGPGNP